MRNFSLKILEKYSENFSGYGNPLSIKNNLIVFQNISNRLPLINFPFAILSILIPLHCDGSSSSSHHKHKNIFASHKSGIPLVYEFPYFSIWLVKLKWFHGVEVSASNNNHRIEYIRMWNVYLYSGCSVLDTTKCLYYAFISFCAISPWDDKEFSLETPPEGFWGNGSQSTKFYSRL